MKSSSTFNLSPAPLELDYCVVDIWQHDPRKETPRTRALAARGQIRFKLLENHWIQVTSDRRNYKLVGMSKENFPALPQFPHALVKIPAKLLADLIAKTTFATSR